MTAAVMQPYIFPYLGYFQLVNAVDTFVFFDDVNFVKKGWIHRNQLLQNETPIKFTVPLIKASQNKPINDIFIFNYTSWKEEFRRQIEHCYSKAPNYIEVKQLIFSILNAKEFETISELARQSVVEVSSYLGIDTPFLSSSDIDYIREDVGGQQKIISICKGLNVGNYINPFNGRGMYNADDFERSNIKLNFLKMNDVKYKQFKNAKFTSSLSIIDVLMFNSIESTQILLNEHTNA